MDLFRTVIYYRQLTRYVYDKIFALVPAGGLLYSESVFFLVAKGSRDKPRGLQFW